MRRAVLICALAAVGLGGCISGMGRINTYGWQFADAHFRYEGRRFQLYVHPKDDTLLLQPGMRALVDGGEIEDWPTERHLRAVQSFLNPTGCTVGAMTPLDLNSGSWEAAYTCPAGVDLRGLIVSQREQLRAETPISLGAPSP